METGASSSSNGEGFLSRMALNDNKAGMEGLDRDKINKIIMESSKGSRFYENELKKERQLNRRIEGMMLQKAQITEQQLRTAQAQVDRMTLELEKGRDLSRVIVHVDMDAFYAAVEMRDCPELKDQPMAVGSMSMLSTSNYHARKFGVRAGMPGFIAKKLCPHLAIVPTNFDKYRAVSAEVREIFADYDPHFLPMSLDEAYLDITDHLEQRRSWPEALRTHRLRTATATAAGEVEEEGLSPVLFEDSPSSSPGDVVVFGSCGEEAVREMRFRIEQKTTLTASAGIAPNMMLAKVCSDKKKPNDQYRLLPTRQAVMDFIQELPVRKVSGIGKVTENMLGALGITSCAHLGQEMALVSLLFSETSWHHFIQISLGLGSTHIERDGERKSMSTERTFGEMSVAEEQLSLCRELCQDLAQDLSKETLKGKTVTLKLKNVNFEVKSRAWTLPYAVATADEIFAVAKNLLKAEIDNAKPQPLRLRLMGVRISAFVSSDDKKPLQKSIVGFLQQGGADSSGSSQKSVTEPVFKSPVQPLPVQRPPTGCPPLVKQSQEEPPWGARQRGVEEEPPWGARQRGVEEGRPGGQQQQQQQQQQSFFQRAQAQRLRLQAERGDAPGAGDGKDSSSASSSSTDTRLLKNRVPSAGTPTSAGSVPDAATTAAASGSAASDEARASTSAADGLTCPVCFGEVRTADLAVFNRHIDRCLSGVSVEPNDRPDSEPYTDAGRERGTRAEREECEERPGEKEMAERGDCQTREDSRDPVGPASTGSPGTTASLRHESHDLRGPTLTCPVCQVTQDTDDLAVFNRHVDLCLNQEVLHELGGLASVGRAPRTLAHGKVKDRDSPLQRGTHKGKSKRRGSSPPPPSKKTKAPGPQNTIDRFFR